MTGPDNFHPHGVAPVLARNGCTVDNQTAATEGLQLVRQGHPCAQTRRPELIGIVQVWLSRVWVHVICAWQCAGCAHL